MATVTAAPADTAAARAPHATSWWTKLSYGVGMGAIGVKDNGFSYFMLIFYSQVVGLDARLVGLALTAALVFDAFVDPMIGYWSDNLRSRWGRRHPFMYAAAVPLAGLWFLLWNPPVGLSQWPLFAYLLGMAILNRMFVSMYEVPSGALAAELSPNYDERSSLMSFRYYFAWTVGNTMSVLMFAVIFPAFATAAIKNGQFNRESYHVYALIASALIFACILISALGTHARIPHLMAPPPKRQLTIGKIFREIFETLANRSFVALFISQGLGAIAAGLSAALAFYFLTYFWRFPAQTSSYVIMGVFVSAFIGSFLAPLASRTIGKKRAAIIIGLVAFLGSPFPIALRILGLLPDNGPIPIFWFYFFANMLDVGLIIGFQILADAMMADLVEQSELKTGRRSEGVFYSAVTFVRKLVNGLGLLMAGFVLTAAGLKAGAAPSQVSQETLTRLGAIYAPTIVGLWMAMLLAIGFYTITRDSHEANLAALSARRAAS
jgi:Na+/melibiose symporter-like transporter